MLTANDFRDQTRFRASEYYRRGSRTRFFFSNKENPLKKKKKTKRDRIRALAFSPEITIRINFFFLHTQKRACCTGESRGRRIHTAHYDIIIHDGRAREMIRRTRQYAAVAMCGCGGGSEAFSWGAAGNGAATAEATGAVAPGRGSFSTAFYTLLWVK